MKLVPGPSIPLDQWPNPIVPEERRVQTRLQIHLPLANNRAADVSLPIDCTREDCDALMAAVERTRAFCRV